MKKIIIVISLLLILLAVVPYINSDSETKNLDTQTRSQLSGRFINTKYGVIHYQLQGNSTRPLVVLVHGFSVPYYIWDDTFKALVNDDYRVLRFDLFGRGYSDRPRRDYNLTLFREQLEQLLAALDIVHPFHLVGLSMGGPIVTDFANHNPKQLQSLTLVDPAAQGRASIFPLNLPLIGEYMMRVFVAPQMAASQMSDFKNGSRFSAWPEKFRNQMQYQGFNYAILSTIRNLSSDDPDALYQALGRSQIPVKLIWGEHDTTVPYVLHKKLVKAIPQVSFSSIANAGHIPNVETPEIFYPLLREFIRQNGSAITKTRQATRTHPAQTAAE